MTNSKKIGSISICSLIWVVLSLTISWNPVLGADPVLKSGGKIADQVNQLKRQNAFNRDYNLFTLVPTPPYGSLSDIVKNYTTLSLGSDVSEVLASKPEFIRFKIPIDNGAKELSVLLYKVNISPNGYTLITSDGLPHVADNIVNYRGCIDNDMHSLASITFSENEIMAIVANDEGNYVIGKLNNGSGSYIVYNDKNLVPANPNTCGAKANILPVNTGGSKFRTSEATTTKCVNMYWETDYDIYVNKGNSVSNVNTYIQGVFNQTAALYANDGITISLQTSFVWTTDDPYTGPSTGDYLDQFGTYRTTFAGDVATLLGYKGGGGIAYVGTLCIGVKKFEMAYCGISSTYGAVPTYSWTIECITHENGHVLGSNHTHDCAWNGNNTKIDDCGGVGGYSSGTCTPAPNPLVPVGGGTIMSYCHLTSSGINFNLGFGPQPTALIVGNINNGSCLSSCGCASPSQPTSLTGTTSTCPNSTTNYTASAVSGATSYSWSLPTGWTGSSSTNTITAVAGSTSGNVVITANNSCGSSAPKSITVTIAVPAKPAAIAGSTGICSGSTQTYSVTAVSGATSYIWTLPSGWSGSSTTNSITVTAGSSGGTVSVKANNSCGSSAAQTFTATVSTIAQPGSIAGNATVCSGAAQTYSVTPVSGATSYTWTLPSGWTGSSTTNSIAATAGSAGGSITVKANNNCGSSAGQSMTATVGSSLAQPGAISGSVTVCKSASQVYSVSTVPGATSYTWTLPSGWTGSSTTNSITATTGTAGGTISVAANSSCGNSTAQTLAVTVTSAVQAGSISGSATICASSSQVYSISSVTGATSYIWTLPSGWTGASVTNSITATAGTAGGTISVKAANSCGAGTAQTLVVSIAAVPGQPAAITGNSPVCKNSLQTYTVPAVTGAASYTWTLPSGWSGTSTANSITVTAGSSGGTISVKANNACGKSGTARTLALSVSSVAPAQPGAITGKIVVCKSSAQTYSIAAVSGATTYIWSLPSGWTGSSTSKSINVIPGDSSGLISVIANNDCGSSTVRTLSVTPVSAVPAKPAFIFGSPSLCKSSKTKYVIQPVANATSYTWSLPSGWSGSSTADTIMATGGSYSGFISIKAVNACGAGVAQALPVTALTVPAQPSVITGSASVCTGSTVDYSVQSVSNVSSYTWTLPNGWTGSSNTNTISPITGTSGGNVMVKANNSCGSSSTRTLAVSVSASAPAVPGAISGNKTVISRSLQTYAISAVSGAKSYTWTLPNGWMGTSTTTSIKVTVGDSSGVISVIANNPCGSSIPQTVAITVTGTAGLFNNSGLENQSQGFSLYPNPAEANVTLSFSEEMTDAHVEIYNLMGQMVYDKKYPDISRNTSVDINLAASPGAYMVRVTGSSGNQFIQKLVIQK